MIADQALLGLVDAAEFVVCSDHSELSPKLAALGRAAEKIYVPQFYQNRRLEPLALVWQSPLVLPNPDKLDFRGDEVMFETIDNRANLGWIVGHPRAVIKWAVSMPHCFSPRLQPMYKSCTVSETLIWAAYRIGLRVLEKPL